MQMLENEVRDKPGATASGLAVPLREFNLLRWFSVISLLIITAVAGGLGYVSTRFVVRDSVQRDAMLTAQFIQAMAQAEVRHSQLPPGTTMGELLDPRLDLQHLQFTPALAESTRVEFLDHVEHLPDTLLANVYARDRAKIHVGDKIPVLTSVASAQGFVSQNVNYIEVGIKLDVEPVIQMQDQVSIKVGMEVSNITDQVTTSSGVLAYTIGSRNANTTLQLRNNETQILAGLFRDDEQKTRRKVPGLGNLPLIGKLFSSNNEDKRKNEIVLLITPRIMHNLSPASSVYSLIPSGIAATANPVGAGGARTVQAIDTTPSAPVVTPQSTQSSNMRNDSGFANQMMNSNDSATVQP